MRTPAWLLFWDFVHLAWVVACYVMTAVCVYKSDYAQACFWLCWLILDSVNKKGRY